MTTIAEWCVRWNLPPQALSELCQLAYQHVEPNPAQSGSETRVGQECALQAPSINQTLWRNNNGAATDQTNRVIRYGLGNVSKQVNEKFKSSDWIGITSVIVQPYHIGKLLGVFTAVETKKPGWTQPKNARDMAQLNFILKVQTMGGIGMFATSADQVKRACTLIR